ncbi:HlyD family efflux transporter periplasmic adaptor subunit [Pseudolysobacter antarcticus]|uniref:HlyD family efflux transporter periplasmic adaptor subunit n=1 Tax=Pseudolysobacter antarcticus TaxID=2511995 RepID=A0A411HN37_9GAMM|nr:efflux RND transporter periplasmic adaptor subunit [Pseudolysobacter antarcticus]QBB71886.1 HlyD family efflux transporter periplasmic adaptor subunit [Pseudolysobacter antarcticus]
MIRDTAAQDRRIEATAPSNKRWLMLGAGGVAVLLLLIWVTPSLLRMLSINSSVNLGRLHVAEVKRGNLVRDVSVQGRVVAAVSPTLYTPAAGTVTLAINAGDKVQKDQVLAEVFSPELNNKLDQERSTVQSLDIDVQRSRIDSRKQQLNTQKLLDQAEIDRVGAEREVQRNQQSFEKGATSELAVLRAKDVLAKAELEVANARKDVGLVHESLDFDLRTKGFALTKQKLLVTDLERQVDALKIRSPVSGQVGTLLVAQKANVAANAPLLSVVDLTAFEVEVLVPETYAHDLGVGMNAEISIGAGTAKGEVSAISPEVVNGQVTGRVRFSDKVPEGLRQNQRLSTRILLDEHPNVLMVERGSFVDTGGGRFAYVVKDGIAEKRKIQIGAAGLDSVEIVSGVAAGERIVVSGSDAFNDAAQVIVH